MAPMSAPVRFGQYLYTTLTGAVFGAPGPTTAPRPEDEEPSTSQVPMHEPGQFEPFLADVLEVKNDLCKGLRLPMEIVDTIVDFAEYWPHTTTVRRSGVKTVRTGSAEEEQLILRSYPLGYLPRNLDTTECLMLDESSYPTVKPQPWRTTKEVQGDANEEVRNKWLTDCQLKGDHPCRKIVFTIKSHDQGWGGGRQNKGTYKGSYTWFDVGKEELVAFREGNEPSTLPPKPVYTIEVPEESSISTSPITCAFHTIIPRTESSQTSSDDVDIEYKFHHALEPDMTCLQKNLTAVKTLQMRKIVWSCDDNIDPDSIYGKQLDTMGRGRATATGEFVRNMRIGDVVTVWAKARFQAWVNIIEEVKIDVYWAV